MDLIELLHDVTELRRVTPEDCRDCSDDVYNGQLAEKCWGRDYGKLAPSMLVPNYAEPPWDFPVTVRPSCYKCKGHVTVAESVVKDTNAQVRRKGG